MAELLASGHLQWQEVVLGGIPFGGDEFGFLDVSPVSFSAMCPALLCWGEDVRREGSVQDMCATRRH
jgi:hypothetical protein